MPLALSFLTKNHFLLLLLVLSSGCVTVGNPEAMNQDRLSQIILKESTQEEIQGLIGPPSNRSKASSLLEIWNYDLAQTNISTTSMIPLIGPFIGDSTFCRGAIVMEFNPQGIIQTLNIVDEMSP